MYLVLIFAQFRAKISMNKVDKKACITPLPKNAMTLQSYVTARGGDFWNEGSKGGKCLRKCWSVPVFLKENFTQIMNSESKFSKSQISFLTLYHLNFFFTSIMKWKKFQAFTKNLHLSKISCYVQYIEVWVKTHPSHPDKFHWYP